MENIQDTLSGKTSREPSRQTRARTSRQSLLKSAKSKTAKCLYLSLESGRRQGGLWETVTQSHGGSSMLNFGEYPKEDNASTLSQILMEGVPEKYYLSQKACQGILRRASSRGKVLPAVLQKALERMAVA